MRKSLLFPFILFSINSKVNAQCDPAFTFSVNVATVQVYAIDTTSPNISHYWRFGDGSVAWTPNASYTYLQPGTYTLTHIVRDSLNTCVDSTQQQVTISFAVSCTASFNTVRDSVYLNKYYFTSTSQTVGGNVALYQWIVNGITVTYGGPAFTYTFQPGTDTVCLTILTWAGCTSSSCQVIETDSTNICNLTGSFTWSASPSNPKQISFFVNPSSGPMLYNWNFGDGYTSTLKSPVHIYANAGYYNVSLVVIDTLMGCGDSARQNIQVHGTVADSCTASFTYTVNPSQPNQLSFTAVSNQTITSQTWWIDNLANPYDSVVITTANPTYTFTDSGSYLVCVYITTNTGCTGWSCDSIYVVNPPARMTNVLPSYPNPARNSVTVNVELTSETRIYATVYDLSGTPVYSKQQLAMPGSNQVTIPISRLTNGQYFIDIRYGNQQKRSIFQKL